MVWQIKDGFRATRANLVNLKRKTDDPAIKYVLREVIRGNDGRGVNTYESRVTHLRLLRDETEFVYTNERELRRFVSQCNVQPTLDKYGNVSYYMPALRQISAAASHIFELTTNRNGVAI